MKSRKRPKTYKKNLLYPELSYKIIGILFDVFIKLGYGYSEKQYHKAIEAGMSSIKLSYKRELPVRLNFKGKFITTLYLDFLIDNRIILEIKQGNRFYKKDIDQVHKYLEATGLKLGILARFTRSGVKFLRIVNDK